MKNNENRVAATPAGVFELVRRGHTVVVERGAGVGSRISDEQYIDAGAVMADYRRRGLGGRRAGAQGEGADRRGVPAHASRPDALHLSAPGRIRACADALLAAGTTGIAYETVQLADRSLPLLQPMSEVAGRLSAQVGAYHLMSAAGGRGMLLGGVPGTPRPRSW